MSKPKNVIIENARILFRNFSGKAGRFNPEGSRNFSVLLDGELPELLENDGWNVKWLEPREEGEDRQAYMPVAVSYTNYPPKILMISDQGKTVLTQETIQILDWAEIENIDLIIRPYSWEVQGKTGIKAYVKSMYVSIVEDEFESKYYDIPYSGSDTEAIIPDEFID